LRFFEDYKTLEDKSSEVGAPISREEAVRVIREAALEYLKRHPQT
jgi:hypothetical protein